MKKLILILLSLPIIGFGQIQLFDVDSSNKELLKATDLLGRETKGTKNEVLFYIYDDGTVEKRIVIE